MKRSKIDWDGSNQAEWQTPTWYLSQWLSWVRAGHFDVREGEEEEEKKTKRREKDEKYKRPKIIMKHWPRQNQSMPDSNEWISVKLVLRLMMRRSSAPGVLENRNIWNMQGRNPYRSRIQKHICSSLPIGFEITSSGEGEPCMQRQISS